MGYLRLLLVFVLVSVAHAADTTPPTIPTGLSATAVSCSQINLAWNASTDPCGSGVAGYNVYKNTVFLKQVTNATTSDLGLVAGTTYSYTVSAVDVATNESAQSSAASATTLTGCTAGGTLLWNKTYGGAGAADSVSPNAVTVDSTGNLFVTGSFNGTLDFGGGTVLTSAGNSDIFLAKYTSAGALVWAQRFGSTAADAGWGIGIDAAGAVLVTGAFQGTVDFGGGGLTSAAGNDIFIAKYSTAGAFVWAQRFGSTLADQGYSIKSDASSNVFVTGFFNGTVNFGTGPIVSNGSADIFLMKLSSSGTVQWAKGIGGAGSEIARNLAVDTAGNVVIVGYYAGAANFGGGVLTSAGFNDVFVAKYTGTTGAFVWAQRFGSVNDDRGAAVATSSSNEVVIVGTFADVIDFGGGPLPNTGGGGDDFLAKFSGAGVLQWAKGFGTALPNFGEVVNAVTIDSSGNVILTGAVIGSVNFGGGALVNTTGTYDMLAAKFNSTGTHQWSKRFAGSNDDYSTGVAVDSSGKVGFIGYFSGTIDFGAGAIANQGGQFSPDGVLTQLAP